MYKGAKVRVDAAKVPLRNRTNDVAWARQLVSRAVDVKTGYLGALTAKGTTFAKKFEELTMRLPFAEGDWATLPMNHVLWLYALGCQQEEHKQLYIGLAHAYGLACRARATDLAVNKTNIPVSPACKALLARPAATFRLPRDRTFARLNMAITGLCFSVFGKTGKTENQRVTEALICAAPVLGMFLPPVANPDGYAANPHTASVSELNRLTSTMLFTTLPARDCKLLLLLLLRRAWPMYSIGTREVGREDFAATLLTYITLSIFSDFDQSRKTSLTFSNSYLW